MNDLDDDCKRKLEEYVHEIIAKATELAAERKSNNIRASLKHDESIAQILPKPENNVPWYLRITNVISRLTRSACFCAQPDEAQKTDV